MEITFEVEIRYGPEEPEEGVPSPTAEDISTAVRRGLEEAGFASVDVRSTQL